MRLLLISVAVILIAAGIFLAKFKNDSKKRDLFDVSAALLASGALCILQVLFPMPSWAFWTALGVLSVIVVILTFKPMTRNQQWSWSMLALVTASCLAFAGLMTAPSLSGVEQTFNRASIAMTDTNGDSVAMPALIERSVDRTSRKDTFIPPGESRADAADL
ncbi:MAG: hypothetical protein ABIR91_02590, partial [Candidatus Saccharimonadales bacterium]